MESSSHYKFNSQTPPSSQTGDNQTLEANQHEGRTSVPGPQTRSLKKKLSVKSRYWQCIVKPKDSPGNGIGPFSAHLDEQDTLVVPVEGVWT